MKKLLALLMILCLCAFVTGCPPAAETPDDTPAANGDNGDTTVDEGTPDDGTPDEGTPDEGTPDDGTPDEGTPDDGTPVDDELKIPEPELDLELE